ncbi:MAG: sel1 repeat family protein [Deltaproteobacteria bacterium]|nr:sel1 repeat family protein [Deltaproteobacteria bacterium]
MPEMKPGAESKRAYKDASPDELVAWANEGDKEALNMVVTDVIVRAEKPLEAKTIVDALSSTTLGQAEGSALYRFGKVYQRVGQLDKALTLLKAASEKGDKDAPLTIGSECERGGDLTEALRWYRLGADRGDAFAQFMAANFLYFGKGCNPDKLEALRYASLSADQGYENGRGFRDLIQSDLAKPSGPCIIATACIGDARVMPLRRLRDEAILGDPVLRDFFHVFWSRYYEWSPGVARLAAQDRHVAEHIRWAFLSPWLSWLEIASIVGRRAPSAMPEADKERVLHCIATRMEEWLHELPAMMEGKCPADTSEVFESFERLGEATRRLFESGGLTTAKR